MKKKDSKTVLTVYELAAPIAESLGLTLWDIRFAKEGSMWILSVFIDKEGGVSINDCEAMSRPLDAKLDEVDPIEQSYCLEVSSAGMERELTRDWHFDVCKGETVSVKMIRPVEGEREFIGELQGLKDDNILLRTENGTVSLPFDDAAYVRIYVDFDNLE